MQPHTPATPGTIRPWLPNQSGRRSPWRAHCSPERAACLHPQRTVSLNGLQPQQLWAGLLGAHPSPALQPLRGSCPGLGGRGPLCPQERALALMDTGTYTAWGTGSRRGRLPLGTRGPSVFGCTSLKGAGWNVCTCFPVGRPQSSTVPISKLAPPGPVCVKLKTEASKEREVPSGALRRLRRKLPSRPVVCD